MGASDFMAGYNYSVETPYYYSELMFGVHKVRQTTSQAFVILVECGKQGQI